MPMYNEVLQSAKTERFKRIMELSNRKRREKANRFIVEGPQAVRELLQWMPSVVLDLYVAVDSTEPDAAFINPTIGQCAGLAMQAGAYVHKATVEVMHHVSGDCQGIFAIADLNQCRELMTGNEQADVLDDEQLDRGTARAPLIAAFWQVRDPGNAGTVIRSADAAGCECVVLVGDCVDVFNPKVIRSTTGSLFHLPILTMDESTFAQWCHERGMTLVAADVYGTKERSPRTLPVVLAQRTFAQQPTCVLFGNEARGLETGMLEQADDIVSIPIYGKAESLNLATSASIMLMSMAMSSHVETI
ncbi:TrmH family RNA methyltransferase [Bifidobacterium gallicum]|nr:RNA methyltransferase [Bifidobacterium gallicum]KFI58858.1 rRNA methyltransferase [Bifidobacterium gallicum DSM 20093 = LMG 11596]